MIFPCIDSVCSSSFLFFIFYFSLIHMSFYIIVFLSGLFSHLDDIAYIPPPDSVPYIFFSHSARTMYASFLTSCDEDLVISTNFLDAS